MIAAESETHHHISRDTSTYQSSYRKGGTTEFMSTGGGANDCEDGYLES